MGLLTLGKNYLYWTFSFAIAGHLVHRKSKIWRAFWGVLFVATITAFFLHSASTLIEYLAYEKTTVIRLYSASSAPFPAVTICNLNPFKNSAVNQSQALSNLISAYKYTLDKKGSASDPTSVSFARKKRAPPCDKTQQASVKAPSRPTKQNYVIEGYNCGTTYNLKYQLCGKPDLTITLSNISAINYQAYNQDMDKGVYVCFHDLFCNNFCNTWDSGLDALTNLTQCAQDNFNYPPSTDGFNFMALIAESYSSYCNLTDKGCKLGLYTKKSATYPGYFWYKDCYVGQYFGYNANLLTMFMDGCDNTTVYELNTYLVNTCTGYIKNISDALSDTLDETDCGTICGLTCPYSGTNLCFYNQQNLCAFYKKCTTTGTTTISQSTTKQISASTTTKKQSTTPTSSTTLTSKSSTAYSAISNTVSSAGTVKSTMETTPSSTSSSDDTSTTTNFGTSTNSETQSTETRTSSESTTSSTTETSITDLDSTTKSTLLNDDSTTSDYDSSTSSSSTTTTTDLITTSSTTAVDTKSTVVSSTKTSPISFSTYSSTRLTTQSTSKASTPSSTRTSEFASQSSKTSTTAASSTFPNLLTKSTTVTTTITNKWPNVPSTKYTTVNSQATSVTSSTQSPSSKTTTNLSPVTNKPPSTSPSTTTTTVTMSKLANTLPLDQEIVTSETTTTVNMNNPPVTNGDGYAIETTAFPEFQTNTVIPTTTLQHAKTTPSLILTTKDEDTVTTAGDTTDQEDLQTKQVETTTISNSFENVATTVEEATKTTEALSTVSYSKTTPFYPSTTPINDNQIISSTSNAITSPVSVTVQHSSKSTENNVKTTYSTNTILFSSSSNPLLTSSSTAISTRNGVTFIPTNTTMSKTSMKITTTTKKQEQSSTVKVTSASTTSKTTKPTTTKPKTTKTTSSYSKTSTKQTTTSTPKTTTKQISIITTKSSEKATTKTTPQSTKTSVTSSTRVSQNSLLNISLTSTSPLSTQPSQTTATTTTSSTTTNFLNQTTSLQSTTTFAVSTSPTNTVTTTSTPKQTQQAVTQVTTPSNFLTTTSSITELEKLSKSYKLNSSQSSITIETNAQQSLITIAASLTDEEKDALGYKIGDLIQTCIIDGVPCNIERDFTQIYDVDYGFCYTFNYGALYNTTKMGSNHGLKMVVLSDINEYIATSSEQGIKVVVHFQEESPFPNVDGYRSATGKEIDLRVTYGLVSRLDAPYGTCNSLDKIKELNQPFYFNGTYTVEGCYRSCFQQKVSIACNCSDPRFPLPTDLSTSFCKISDTKKYSCYEKYIEDNGDYYNVEDCSCAISCDETTFTSAVYYSNWPYGTFFYQALCTNATLMNGTDCQKYYRDNGVLVQVSYARLGYETIEEEPVNSAFDLFNDLAGNTGLWIGFSAVSAAEIGLILLQICLWICTPWELKEVPSCRERNFPEPETDENSTEETNSTSTTLGAGAVVGGLGAANPFYHNLFNGDPNNSRHLIEPKSFPNDLRRRHPGMMVADPSSIYESIKPVSHVDVYDSKLITPTPVHSAVNESIPEL